MSPRRVEGQPPSASGAAGDHVAADEPLRLQKILAFAGLGSRRACEELIAAGRVQVNGVTATLGARADPRRDVIRVDGDRLPTAADLVHLAIHKPAGMVSAMSDPEGRACIGDLVRDRAPGLHHVGRLDADSEGLLLVTNDGALSHRLMHPSYEVPKRYLVEIEGTVPRALGRTLRTGVELEDGPAHVDEFGVVDTVGSRSSVEVVLHEGRKHVVRRMFEAAGHPVQRLVRTSIGPIRLGDMRPGRTRHLSAAEVQSLYRLTGL